jgi:hypothetical protein
LLTDLLFFLGAGERSFEAALFLFEVRVFSSAPKSKRLGFLCVRGGRLAVDGKEEEMD